MKSLLNDPRYAKAERWFTAACLASSSHAMLAKEALTLYGDHGPAISGCVRDHFPDDVKNHLRELARACSSASENGHKARPRYARKASMVHLAREVATRDGSGFYGPQPYPKA